MIVVRPTAETSAIGRLLALSPPWQPIA